MGSMRLFNALERYLKLSKDISSWRALLMEAEDEMRKLNKDMGEAGFIVCAKCQLIARPGSFGSGSHWCMECLSGRD